MPDACEIDHCDNNCAKCMWGKDIESKGLKLVNYPPPKGRGLSIALD
jgi:hypothetical protein